MLLDGITSFYVNVLSGCSMNLYPENTLSKFRVKLPYNIKFSLEDNWYVGITRFSCTSIKNIQNKENSGPRIIFKFSSSKHNFTIVQILQAVPRFVASIDHSSFFNKYTDTNTSLLEYNFQNKKFLEVYADRLRKTIKIPTEYVLSPRELFDIYFSQIIGKDRQIQVDYLRTWFKNRQEPFLVTPEVIKNYSPLISDYEPLNYLCIYTDMIKPRIIGDRLTRALYMQPIQNESDWSSRNVIDVKNVEYYPLEFIDMSEINILFADETGEQINFNNSTFSTMVLLHFKRGI